MGKRANSTHSVQVETARMASVAGILHSQTRPCSRWTRREGGDQ